MKDLLLHLLNLPALLLLSTACTLNAQSSDEDLFFTPTLSVEVHPSYESYLVSPAHVPQESALLYVRQETHRDLHAILPIVFFDEASYVIPERYQVFRRASEARDYEIGKLVLPPTRFADAVDLAKYHEVLNIVGDRMWRDTTIRVELQPTWSAEPGETAALAGERADVVREYLVNIWQIEPGRISLRPPVQMADSADNFFAQQEARSVRIYPSSPSLLRPLSYRQISPGEISYNIDVGLEPRLPHYEITRMMLVARMGDSILSENWLSIPDEGREYRWEGWWSPHLQEAELAPSVTFTLLMLTADGVTRRSNSVQIPVVITVDTSRKAKQDYSDTAGVWERSDRTGGFIIPFFPTGSADLDEIQRPIIDDIVREWRDTIAGYGTRDWHLSLEALHFNLGEMGSGGESECNQRMKEISTYFRHTLPSPHERDADLSILFSPHSDPGRSAMHDSAAAQRQRWKDMHRAKVHGYELLADLWKCSSDEERERQDSLFMLRAERLEEELSERFGLSDIDVEAYEVFIDQDQSYWLPETRYYLRWVRVSLQSGSVTEWEEE